MQTLSLVLSLSGIVLMVIGIVGKMFCTSEFFHRMLVDGLFAVMFGAAFGLIYLSVS